MEGGGVPLGARTPEDVFNDFRGRRAGIIKALSTEMNAFFKLCDPEKENLCLYGFPNETWKVTLPAEEVPPEIPEPAFGINFARDGMSEMNWLSLVAVHSDSWLMSVAFYLAARFGFDKEARKRLFHMINELPTVYEVFTDVNKKSTKEKYPDSTSKSGEPSSKTPQHSGQKPPPSKPPLIASRLKGEANSEGPEEEDHGSTMCGACGDNYGADEFWICCDVCEKWFHGKCVKITPARAEHIKQYKCPGCSSKRVARA